MNHVSWRITAELPHTTTLTSASTVVYQEKEKPLTGYPATLASVQGLPLVIETACEFIAEFCLGVDFDSHHYPLFWSKSD